MICPTPPCGSTKLVGSVTFQVFGGMTVKIMTAVSNARKGGSEQWVRRKKQIKRAREITAFRSLCIWKKME